MTHTLFDATYRTAQRLGVATTGVATSGSTTTIIDTARLVRYPADYFSKNGEGTAWILYDAGGSGAAPEGEFGRIIDFDKIPAKVTLGAALTAAVAASDRYAVAPATYPLDLLIEKVNEAIHDIGWKVVDDDTSLDTAANQTEFTLPVANMRLKQVYVETITTDANDNKWVPVENWTIQKETAGTADTLIFLEQFPASYDIRIVYETPHGDVYASSDNIDEQYPLELITAKAALACLEWRQLQQGSGTDSRLDRQLRAAERVVEQQMAQHKKPFARRIRPRLGYATQVVLDRDEPPVPS